MSDTAERTDPAPREKVKKEITAGAKGGGKSEWSARKAQMAVAEYKKRDIAGRSNMSKDQLAKALRH